ncbi:hypothetical protein [Paenibacillus sp. sgz500958]|uniref:hypothetical protein n=1 Tax=Paenibacillus sp. sgz500958 TaxID=3242475 RepID=UPI0036D3E6F4
MFVILQEPTGEVYRSLLEVAINLCDEFILVKRDQMPLEESGVELLKALQPFFKEVKKQDNWPGTRLINTAHEQESSIRTDKEKELAELDTIKGLLIHDLSQYG